MGSEKLRLKWNDFETNISTAFQELRDEKDFFDVTIACGDGSIQAHKVILSACSPFFRNILRRNPHQHPLLFLTGVKFTDLQSVLNFMYYGEVSVDQEELNSFLGVAEELQVKGLTQNNQRMKLERNSPLNKQHRRPSTPQQPKVVTDHHHPRHVEVDEDIQEINTKVKSEAIVCQPSEDLIYPGEKDQSGNYDQYANYDQYNNTRGTEIVPDSNMDRSQLGNYVDKQVTATGTLFVCNLCGKSNGQKSNMINHVENIHFPGQFSYPCQYCDKVTNTKTALYQHMFHSHKEQKSQQN